MYWMVQPNVVNRMRRSVFAIEQGNLKKTLGCLLASSEASTQRRAATTDSCQD